MLPYIVFQRPIVRHICHMVTYDNGLVPCGGSWCHMVEHCVIWLNTVPYGCIQCHMVRCDVIGIWFTIPSKT
jgi:hypothetical protein